MNLQRVGPERIQQRLAELAGRMDDRFGNRPDPAPAPKFEEKLQGALTGSISGNDGMLAPMRLDGLGIQTSSIDELVAKIAKEEGVDAGLLHAVIQTESAGDPNAVSNKGARGLMQLMPATAASLGVTDPTNPEQNVRGGARYLKGLIAQHGGDLSLALAAYNAGPGNVRKYGGIPPFKETQAYVTKVLDRYGMISGGLNGQR